MDATITGTFSGDEQKHTKLEQMINLLLARLCVLGVVLPLAFYLCHEDVDRLQTLRAKRYFIGRFLDAKPKSLPALIFCIRWIRIQERRRRV